MWRSAGLGAPPAVLRLASPGRTHTARRRIEAEVWAALSERRPGWGAGADPDLERLLHLLAKPAIRVEVRAWGTATIRAAVAGGTEMPCCTALRRRGGAHPVHLARRRHGRRARHRATGTGGAAVVAAVDLEGALRRPTGAGLRTDLVDRGVDPAESGLIARMLDGIDRRAQISVLVPDRLNILRRAGEPLEVLDAPARPLPDDPLPWSSTAPPGLRRAGCSTTAACTTG